MNDSARDLLDSSHDQLKQSLLADLAGLPREEQLARLYVSCTGDSALFEEMAALIQAEHTHAPRSVHGGDGPMIGREIGPYRIVRLLGEGGMGAVFLAERTGDFTMQVALKLIRGATPELIGRFTRERQILASLQHPAIARLLDGGNDDEGTPYIVMEYVDGETLPRFAARKQLSVEARLRLFADMCDAVAFAHQNLVIHRDIKPSNVLVDKDGQVKLLDFGLAALQAPDGEGVLTVSTAMTPAYASPEQIAGERLTAATDQYSLGMMLFELLTGSRPFHSTDPSAKPTDRGLPAKPSTVVSRAIGQFVDPPPLPPSQLRARLSGDLDAIVLKALRMEAQERYASVGELAADIRRFLAKQPVLARAPSRGYLLRKFVARHRIETTAAVTVVVGLAAAAGFALNAWHNERIARQNAQQAQEEAAAVNDFMANLLMSPDQLEGQDVRVVDVLAKAAKDAPTQFKDRPLTLALVLDNLANSYQFLGHSEEALPLLEQSWALYRRNLGDTAHRTLEVEYDVVQSKASMESDEAALARWQAFEAKLRAHVPADDETEVYAMGMLGGAYFRMYRDGHKEYAAEANRLTLEQLRRLEKNPTTKPADLLMARANAAALLAESGQVEEAKRLLEMNLEAERRLVGPDSYEVQHMLVNLSAIYNKLGQHEKALALIRQATAGTTKLLGDTHPDTLDDRLTEATRLTELERRDEARAVLIDIQKKAADHANAAEIKKKAAQRLAELK
ncbi:MAG: protein kinase [Burkholderiales bacterium]|nr:protein kinase [Burkholderiales bacterium]